MPLTRPCSFCGNEIEPGTGRMFVKRDGTIRYYCSSKCSKNLQGLGRTPRDVRWTLASGAARGKIVTAAPVSAEAQGEAVGPISLEFTIQLPKGKDIPPAIHDLIDKRFGPGLGVADLEKHFVNFSADPALKGALGLWFKKRNPKKALKEIVLAEYTAFLATTQAKKILKDWLDVEAKRRK